MITDTNSVVSFSYNTLVGVFGGDFMLLALFLLVGIASVFVLARVKASSALIIGVFFVFIFAAILQQLFFIFWLIIIASLFVLINGLRKMITGQ